MVIHTTFKKCWIDIISKCMYQCPYCYNKGNSYSQESVMTESTFTKIISLLDSVNCKSIILTGGEITLHPKLCSFIKYAKDRGFHIGLISTAYPLANFELCKSIYESGCKALVFSCNGYSKETYEKVSNLRGSFKKFLIAVENAKQFKFEKFSFLTTLTSFTAPILTNILDFAVENGIKKLRISNGVPPVYNTDSPYILSPEEVANYTEKFFKYYKDNYVKDIEIKISMYQPLCLYNQDVLNEMVNMNVVSLHRGCQLYDSSSLTFNVNGDVSPCTLFYNVIFGNPIYGDNGHDKNMNGKEFLTWLNEGPPKNFRKEIWRYPSEKCIKCPYWGKICMGGCPAQWLKWDAVQTIKGL